MNEPADKPVLKSSANSDDKDDSRTSLVVVYARDGRRFNQS